MKYRILFIEDAYKTLWQYRVYTKMGWWDLFGWVELSRHKTFQQAQERIREDKEMWIRINTQPKSVTHVVHEE